jgi:hypothetical protein
MIRKVLFVLAPAMLITSACGGGIRDALNVEHPIQNESYWAHDFPEGTQAANAAIAAGAVQYGEMLAFMKVYLIDHDWVIARNHYGVITNRWANVEAFYKVKSGELAGRCFRARYLLNEDEQGGQWSKPVLQPNNSSFLCPGSSVCRVNCDQVASLPGPG